MRDRAKNYANVKAWRAKNKDKVAAQARRRRARVPEKFAAADKRWRERHLEQARRADRERKRAMRKKDREGNRRRSAAFKARIRAKQEAIAGRPRPSHCELCSGNAFPIVFDHCHVRGHFRGWICDRCNRVLGLVKDNAHLLRAMADYLEIANYGPADLEKKERIA